MKVRYSDEGDERVAIVDAWWRANREKAPDLFISLAGDGPIHPRDWRPRGAHDQPAHSSRQRRGIARS